MDNNQVAAHVDGYSVENEAKCYMFEPALSATAMAGCGLVSCKA